MAAAQRLALAVADAGRGAWDSSLVALDAFVASRSEASAPLFRYRVAVVAAWLGAVAPREADTRREAVARVASLLAPEGRAELSWLDGLLAVARNDTTALRAARRSLAGADVALDRSLAAFARNLAGERDAAADSLVRLEIERAQTGSARWESDRSPFLTAVDRLAAARWLTAGGRQAQAARLLTWFEGIPYPEPLTRQANAMIEGLAYLERGRVAEALDQRALAVRYYERFLSVYDAPTPAHRHLMEDARASLRRLSGTSDAR
jgi:hypothetical protein